MYNKRYVMGLKSLTLLLTILGLTRGVVGQECCPNGWVSHSGSCYLLADEKTSTWEESATYCRLHHSHLVKVDNAAEDNFIVYQAQRLFRNTDPTHAQMNNSFWLGGKDDVTEGEWYWTSDDMQFSYTHWHPGQPDSTGGVNQDCLLLYAGSGFHWHDHECSEPAHPLCEIELGVEPGLVIG